MHGVGGVLVTSKSFHQSSKTGIAPIVPTLVEVPSN